MLLLHQLEDGGLGHCSPVYGLFKTINRSIEFCDDFACNVLQIRSGITIATCAIGWLVGVYGSLLKWAPKIHVVLIILLKRATLYDLQKSLKDAITEDKIIVMVKGIIFSQINSRLISSLKLTLSLY